MIKIYVAGASAEKARAAKFIASLVETQLYDVLVDWPALVTEAGSANRGLDEQVRKNTARDALDAVRDCDVLVLLVPAVETRGAWGEFCAALVLNKLVVLSGTVSDADESVFCALGVPILNYDERNGQNVRINIDRTQQTSDAQALTWLRGYAHALDGFPPEDEE